MFFSKTATKIVKTNPITKFNQSFLPTNGSLSLHYFEYPNFSSTRLLTSIRGDAKTMLCDDARSKIA